MIRLLSVLKTRFSLIIMPFHLPAFINPHASFRARLVIVVGLVSLVTILLLSWLVATIASAQVKKDKGALMAEVAHQMMETLDRGIFERQREITIMAAMDAIRDPRVPLAQKQKQLEQLKASYHNYAWIGIADAQGKILAGTGEPPGRQERGSACLVRERRQGPRRGRCPRCPPVGQAVAQAYL